MSWSNAALRRACLSSAALAAILCATGAIMTGADAQSQLPSISVEAPKKKAAPKTAAKNGAPKAVPAGAPASSAAKTTAGGVLATGTDVTITAAEIDQAQPTTIQGLFAKQTTVVGGGTMQANTKVFVHGIEESLLNVSIDGARQPSRNGGFHHNGNNLIDPAMLKGVAVDAGVSPADAGPHALGGSIRYTTKDASDLLLPGQKLGAFATLTWDSNSETFRRSGAAYGKSGGFEILGYGLWADGDAYEDGHGRTALGTDVDLTNYLGKVAYESLSGHRIAFSAEHIHDEGIRQFRNNILYQTGNGNVFNLHELTRETYTVKYTTTKPTASYDPEVSFYSSNSQIHRPLPLYDASGAPKACSGGTCLATGNVEFESIGGKAQNTFHVGPGKLTAGVDFYEDKQTVTHVEDLTPQPQPVLWERSTNVGAFMQYRFSPLAQMRVSTGARVDWNTLQTADGHELDNTGVSPNISAEYDVTRQWTLKASYGYSFGGLPMYEAFLMRAISQPYPQNIHPSYNGPLAPQNSGTYKVGLQFKEGGLLAEASYFSTRIFDPVCADCDESSGYTDVTNYPDIVTKGVDLSVKYAWRQGLLGASFAHIEVEQDGNPLATLFYISTPLGDILKLYGQYEFAGTGVSVGFLSQFAFEYDDLATPLESYDVHNVFAQWIPQAMPSLTLRAEVANVFDSYYVDRATPLNAGYANATPSQGRTFIISGKVQF